MRPASRRVEAPSLHCHESSPGEEGVRTESLRASSRDSVRSGSNLDQRPPIAFSDGDESRRWREDDAKSRQTPFTAPVNKFLAFHSDWPCRTKQTLHVAASFQAILTVVRLDVRSLGWSAHAVVVSSTARSAILACRCTWAGVLLRQKFHACLVSNYKVVRIAACEP